MLKIDNLEYASTNTIVFQRLSVVVLDFFFFWSVYKYISSLISFLTFQILSCIFANLQSIRKTHSTFTYLFARISHIGSYPFSIQWTFILDTRLFAPRGSDIPSPVRLSFCITSMFQTYLSLPCAGIFLLSAPHILSRSLMATSGSEYCKIGCRRSGTFGHRIRPVHCFRTNGSCV